MIQRVQTWSKYRRSLSVMCMVLVFVVCGCAGSFGKWTVHDETTQMFETGTVPEGWNYYYFGEANMPKILVGFHTDYKLNCGEYWTEVDPNGQDFTHMVDNMWWDQKYVGCFFEPKGAQIIFDGKRIGIWFSHLPSATLNVSEDKVVRIY